MRVVKPTQEQQTVRQQLLNIMLGLVMALNRTAGVSTVSCCGYSFLWQQQRYRLMPVVPTWHSNARRTGC